MSQHWKLQLSIAWIFK